MKLQPFPKESLRVHHTKHPPMSDISWDVFSSHLFHLPSAEQQNIEQAFTLAKDAYVTQASTQADACNFAHCAEVASMLADMESDYESIVTALLMHCTEMDTLSLPKIDTLCGGRIALLTSSLLLLDTPIETLRKRLLLMQGDMRIIVIAIADHFCLTKRWCQCASPSREQKAMQEYTPIYTHLAELLSMRDLQEEMHQYVFRLEQESLSKDIATQQEKRLHHSEHVLAILRDAFTDNADQDTLLEYRPSAWNDLKMHSASAAKHELPFCIDFTCKDNESCYAVWSVLHAKFRQEYGSFHDAIALPNSNGSQGLYTTIFLKDGLRVHCTIGTESMHTFAHKGITALCFRKDTVGLPDYFPWMEHINQLSEDTVDSGNDFFCALQNDILTEHIMIHGPNDTVITLPKGATALDSALFALRERGVFVSDIHINGITAPLHTELMEGMHITFTVGTRKTVQHHWLSVVRTYYARIHIRNALGKPSKSARIATGKELLQQMMHKHKKGFLDEFDEGSFHSSLLSLGYTSLDDVCVAMASGEAEPEKVYRALFEPKMDAFKAQHRQIRCMIPANDIAMNNAVLEICQKYQKHITKVTIRTLPWKPSEKRITIQAMLSYPQQQLIIQELQETEIQDVTIGKKYAGLQFGTIIAIMFTIWGLDPVIAKFILSAGAAPVSIAVIRSWTVVFCAFFLMLCTNRSRIMSNIPLHYRSLWIAGVAFALVNIFTYFAIAYGSPAMYNTILRGNAILLITPILLRHHAHRQLISIWILAFAGGILLTRTSGSLSGLLLSLCALASFSIYSAASARFQSIAHISARYPQFLFYTSLISAVVLFPLFPIALPLPSFSLVAIIVAYSALIIIVPYAIFYHLIRYTGHLPIFSNWIHGGVIVTLIAQTAFFGWQDMHIFAAAAAILVLGSIISARAYHGYEKEKYTISQ